MPIKLSSDLLLATGEPFDNLSKAVYSFVITKSKKLLLRVDRSLEFKINEISNQINSKCKDLNISCYSYYHEYKEKQLVIIVIYPNEDLQDIKHGLTHN